MGVVALRAAVVFAVLSGDSRWGAVGVVGSVKRGGLPEQSGELAGDRDRDHAGRLHALASEVLPALVEAPLRAPSDLHDPRVLGIDLLVIPLWMDLVDRDVVRVLDLLFIAKDADGTVSRVDTPDVEHHEAVDRRLWSASSGLLDESDIDEVAGAIEPGSLAGILVYENVWAVPMWTALDRSNARLIGAGRIPAGDLIAVLDAIDPA